MERLYFDYNATAPLRPEVRTAMVEALGAVGNASSVHAEGRAARRRLEAARQQVAGLVGGDPKLVTFTSGGTEANNTVLTPRTGDVGSEPHRANFLLVGATEHRFGAGRRPVSCRASPGDPGRCRRGHQSRQSAPDAGGAGRRGSRGPWCRSCSPTTRPASIQPVAEIAETRAPRRRHRPYRRGAGGRPDPGRHRSAWRRRPDALGPQDRRAAGRRRHRPGVARHRLRAASRRRRPGDAGRGPAPRTSRRSPASARRPRPRRADLAGAGEWAGVARPTARRSSRDGGLAATVFSARRASGCRRRFASASTASRPRPW